MRSAVQPTGARPKTSLGAPSAFTPVFRPGDYSGKLVRRGILRKILMIVLASEVAVTGVIAVIHILFLDLDQLWWRLWTFFGVTVYYTVYSFFMGQPLRRSQDEREGLGRYVAPSLSLLSLVAAATGFVLAMIAIWTMGYSAHGAVVRWAWSGFVVSLGFVAALMTVALQRGSLLTWVPVLITVAGIAASVALVVTTIHVGPEDLERPLIASFVFTATGLVVSVILSRIQQSRFADAAQAR